MMTIHFTVCWILKWPLFLTVLSPEQHWVCAAERDNAGEVPNAHSGGHWGPRLPHRYLDVVHLSVLLLWTCFLISTVVFFFFIEFILYFRIRVIWKYVWDATYFLDHFLSFPPVTCFMFYRCTPFVLQCSLCRL